ncbi:MAG: hypothetical protein GY811_15845 [Myxococcales bacterium]|nr:hypothetical protein [Myxococcales bacterium]
MRIILAITTIIPVLAVGSLAIYRANAEVQSEVIRGRLAQVRALASSLDETLQGARRSLELAAAWWADEREAGETDSPEIEERYASPWVASAQRSTHIQRPDHSRRRWQDDLWQ